MVSTVDILVFGVIPGLQSFGFITNLIMFFLMINVNHRLGQLCDLLVTGLTLCNLIFCTEFVCNFAWQSVEVTINNSDLPFNQTNDSAKFLTYLQDTIYYSEYCLTVLSILSAIFIAELNILRAVQYLCLQHIAFKKFTLQQKVMLLCCHVVLAIAFYLTLYFVMRADIVRHGVLCVVLVVVFASSVVATGQAACKKCSGPSNEKFARGLRKHWQGKPMTFFFLFTSLLIVLTALPYQIYKIYHIYDDSQPIEFPIITSIIWKCGPIIQPVITLSLLFGPFRTETSQLLKHFNLIQVKTRCCCCLVHHCSYNVEEKRRNVQDEDVSCGTGMSTLSSASQYSQPCSSLTLDSVCSASP